MKTITMLSRFVVSLGIGLFLSSTVFASHFTAPTSNQGAGQWTFFTVQATLDGVDLVAGDEIAIYDGNTCVGAFVLTQVCDSSNFFSNNWVAYEQAGSGTVGYTAGHSFTFRCWDASTSTEYTGGTYQWNELIGDGTETDVFPAHGAYPWSYPMLTFTSGNAVTTNLKGTVTNNPDTDSIQNIVVTLTPGSISTTTNSDGFYQFSGLSTGTYNIYFTPPTNSWFKSDSIVNVSIDASTTTTKNMALDSLDGYIAGFVKNVNGVGLDSTVVQVGSLKDTTNYSGYYSISNVPVGTNYTVTATYFGTTNNYEQGTQTGISVHSNHVTSLNFTLHVPPGTLSGTVTDANNSNAVVSGVQVIAIGYDTTTTDASGNFTFSLVPGTYNLTFSKTGFHNASATGYAVTSGNTTNADQNMYSYHWTFNSGDPFSDVWTIYLNNITGDGVALKAGDEIALYNTTSGQITNFVGGAVGAPYFTVFTPSTSSIHVGDMVTITGSLGTHDGTTPGYYDGTFSVKTVYSNRFLVNATWPGAVSGTTGTWAFNRMVGLTYLTGPVSNQGTNLPLVAFSVLSDGSTGYTAGDAFTFKLFIAGGGENDVTNSATWSTDAGYYDPSSGTPNNLFPSGNKFSKVDLNFNVAAGNISISFNNGAQLICNLQLYLIKGNDTIAPAPNYYSYHNTGYTYSSVEAGTYTLSVYGNYYPHTTYTGITLGIGASTTVNLTLNHNPNVTQTIPLHNGYQLISRRVSSYTFVPMATYLTNNGTVDLTKLDFIKDENGTVDNNDNSGSWTSTNVNWSIFRGYTVKMNDNGETLSITSTPINYNVGIAINATSYNIISYLPSYDLPATTAFADLMTDDLEFIRDSYGNTLTKIGGVWVNHIGTCSAGQGYLIKWGGAATTFHYPAHSKAVSAVSDGGELQHFQFINGNPVSNVYTLYVSGQMLEEGDEIAVFDGGTMVGARVINSASDAMKNNVPLFSELFNGTGYHVGDKIIIKYWKASENKEYWMDFNNVTNASNSSYAYTGDTFPAGDAKYSVINLVYSPAGIVDNLAKAINIYPNPASNKLFINSPEIINNIKILSLLGQQIAIMHPESNKFSIDLSGFKQGLYFINIEINNNTVTKKLTIR